MLPIVRPLCLVLTLVAAGHAMAEDASSSELRAQAKSIRNSAEHEFKITSYHCYDKFLVNACLDGAKVARLEKVKEARALEAHANKLDRSKRVKAMEARLRQTESSPANASPAKPEP